MNIIRGKQQKAQRVVIYSPEGLGKSTMGSYFPTPLFIDTEGSTAQLDVARLPKPTSWTMLKEQLANFKNNPMEFQTLVMDTADWAERLCAEHICALGDKNGPKVGIEDFGFGRGYNTLAENFGKMLNFLNDINDLGINIVLLAHAHLKKFEQPDENGSYDRYEMKMEKKTAPLVKEWADMVLFGNYKTIVVENEGGKKKAQGGKRVLYTEHHPCWDAKNRHGLPAVIDMKMGMLPPEIAACIPAIDRGQTQQVQPQVTQPFVEQQVQPQAQPQVQQAVEQQQTQPEQTQQPETQVAEQPQTQQQTQTTINTEVQKDAFHPALYDLMKVNSVTAEEIQKAVSDKGYYPIETPIDNYADDFVKGALIACWDKILVIIAENKKAN